MSSSAFSVDPREEGRQIPPIQWENDYPKPAAPESTKEWGKHLQRTMRLLAESTPDNRNTVRILFYGQSIVGHKKWTDAIVADLRERFPHADIVYENKAIGGFSSRYLVQTAESDLFPWYPDLLVFHVYGAHNDYQRIIHNARARTTAEIAIVTDHLNAGEYDGTQFHEKSDWSTFMSETMVPKVAEAYDCQLVNITDDWKHYLVTNDLPSQALLKDGVHPNDHGCFLLAELVGRQLVYRPDLGLGDTSKDLVSVYEIGKDVDFTNGTLTLPFNGNRVDLLAAENVRDSAPLSVMIDGKKPGAFIGCYTHGRTSDSPGIAWPALLKVTANSLPLVEDWTLTVDEVHEVPDDFSFTVTGSQTGPDGSGRSTKKFVSDSGRVVIEPKAWMNLDRDYRMKKKPITEGFQVVWSTRATHRDVYRPQAVEDPAITPFTTVAQGLPPGGHTLQLRMDGEGRPPIRAIRVYTPPVERKMKIVANPPL